MPKKANYYKQKFNTNIKKGSTFAFLMDKQYKTIIQTKTTNSCKIIKESLQLFNDIKCFNSERSDKLKSYELTEEMFNKKYDKYSALIYRLAFQYTLNKATAEDITQDVFIKLFVNNKRFANDEHEKAWIIRVTINHCKNILQSKSNNHLQLLDTEHIDEHFENRSIEKLDIQQSIKDLSQNERTIILLYYYEDLTTKQISKYLKMNENTVKSHLKRAKIKLKNNLER